MEVKKSTSISTAKRLAEFLGDQMVKDAGLACKFIISKKPEGAPVTERAIPLAIFQSEPSVKRHFLRKWLKDTSISDIDIRQVLDWNYYIERLGGTIQKIITIPAAMQGVSNPVPRVRHPDWLHKKMLEKNDTLKQRRITELFSVKPKEKSPEMEGNVDTDENDGAQAGSEDMFSSEVMDVEDIGKDSTTPVGGRPICNKRKRFQTSPGSSQDSSLSSQDWREALGPAPPMGTTKEERLAWIQYQKKKWALQAEARAARRRVVDKRARIDDGGGAPIARPMPGLGRGSAATLGGFLRRTQRTLLDSPWQIVQIAETNQPGVLKLWALVGHDLHQIKLKVPRIFYVNQRLARAEPETNATTLWKKCNRVLPRSRPVFYLYEYSVPEELFREHSQELMADLSTPDIEGIYETQMSLEFRALLRLGCVCSVDRRVANSMAHAGVPDTFNLDELVFRSVSQQPYLDTSDGDVSLRHLYLYHHQIPNGTRAMFGLFLPPSKKAIIIVLDTVRTNQMPNMSSLYNSERNAKISRGHDEATLPQKEFNFEIRVETDIKQVYRLLQNALLAYRDEKKGPSLLAIQSVHDLPTINSLMPSLAEFPQMTIHGLGDAENMYSTLDWQRVGAKAIVRHYLSSEKVLSISTEQCRYFHVPLGNLPADATLFGADLFYARHLTKQNFVLWCSNTDRPDLGGREADDNRLLTDFEESLNVISNAPNAYSTICVDLEIDSLAVNTLLQSHHVHDIEGTSAGVAFDAMPQASLEDMISGQTAILPSYDETALCSAAFKVLRSMVNAWLRDVTMYRNEFADLQIVHFYRWIRSPNALLYDPALRRTLHNLMKKLFMQLIAEFKRLGSVIIYGNFNKIMLCTKKKNVKDALAYVEYIVTSIHNKELFHSIQITYQQCWEYLLWLDPSNHAGVRGKLPSDMENESENNVDDDDEGITSDKDDTPEIVMNWNLMEYLPEDAACQDNFSAVIAGYIMKVYLHLQDNMIPEGHTPVRKKRASSQSQTQSKPLGLGVHATTAEYAKELITGELAQKLFYITEKIHKKLPSQSYDANSLFPQLPGAHLKLMNPALEFIKAVCKVLSLDSSVAEDVDVLRRNLLRLVKVGNFSDLAEWKDPCISFVLPEVICKGCNHCRDIDLCKDNYRAEDEGRPVWKCPMCNNSYDNSEIEYMLVDTINRKAMANILQDLQCRKCLQIKMENMPDYCTCAGEYNTLISKSDLGIHLRTFRSIAEHFGMPLLLETVDWTLQMNPSLAVG